MTRRAAAIASYVSRKLAKRAAVIVATDTVYGRNMSHQFATEFVKAGGVVSAFPSVDEGHREFPYLVSGFPSQADLIFYGGIYEGAPLLRAMGAAGDKRLLAIGDGCWDVANFLRPAGGAAEQGEGVLVLSGCPEKGHVAGAFARIMRNASDLQNYGANSNTTRPKPC
ncbi:hypothetical protein [Mesorhizobium sp. Cs1321R2N1]|uniref:hypothetical protein n=1 Tax=Mesorhizobium sp. Cs1321R2N1 TaxID=3015174 RepID=UPI00301DEE87